MLGGLTFIMMNESTFKCLSKMQLSDYLLVGKSLFPQGSYIEPNNLAYSSATAKNNTSSRNITKASISPKQQGINQQKNKREIKSNKNEEEFGASINGSNYSTVSSTSEKDNITTYSTNVINGNNSFVTSEPNINDKYALNDNQTTTIDLNRPSPLDDIQNSSSVSTKSITKDDISENSTIPTKVTITTYSTNMLVGNNSFVTSRSIIGDKSSSNENQTTISIHSTVQNLSDGFQTSSINVTAKVTTIHSTNISIENSSMPISSQNLTSTTLKLPITYLLNQSLEIHEATSQNEPIKLKDSSQSRKRPRKKKPTGSITNETKTDDDKDEPTTTEMTEPITFEFSVLSIDSSAGTSSTSASNEAENHLVSYLGFPMVKANVRGRTKSNDGKSIKAPPKVTKMHYAKTSSGSHENVEEDDDTALLINNILISGIALHGIYFGACLLLMIGISKVHNRTFRYFILYMNVLM